MPPHCPNGLTLFGICWQGGGVLFAYGTVTFTTCTIYSNQADWAVLSGHFFHRPDGLTLFGICWQGGGVDISSGTVTFTSCTIYSNQAAGVRACFVNLPGHFFHPRWTYLIWHLLAGWRC